MAVFGLENTSGVIDEIEKYQLGRYIGSSEALWRVHGFHIHKRYPTVLHLAVHSVCTSPHAFLKASRLWRHVIKFRLKTNMRIRLQNDATGEKFPQQLMSWTWELGTEREENHVAIRLLLDGDVKRGIN